MGGMLNLLDCWPCIHESDGFGRRLLVFVIFDACVDVIFVAGAVVIDGGHRYRRFRLGQRYLRWVYPVVVTQTCGSVPKSGQWENTENVTLQKRLIPIKLPSFWRSHAVC